jgi:hypothetical protein
MLREKIVEPIRCCYITEKPFFFFASSSNGSQSVLVSGLDPEC